MVDQGDQGRGEARRPRNRLAAEKSPYLLQHAHNPVDWYPWGEEAFERARREEKPIFLSIGYSTCHWCHVMEHESFEDPQVAALMNGALVSIKVDREERPDIDEVYMTVAQMMTGGGGWPLTIVMTPEKVPFFAATYIPKENRWGRPGMLSLIPAIQDGWKTRRDELLRIAGQVTAALSQVAREAPGEPLSEPTLDLAFRQLSERFDAKHGGFGAAPKFPSPHNLLFLLRYWKRTGSEPALHMVEQTLTAMRNGGIFDHVGFGYHRYATDARWLVPHFEKMLYDQAMLAMAFVEAYQATKKEFYRSAADGIFTYVLRDMTSPQGGFYAAEDADSEGEEGKFYLWTLEELRQALGEEEAALVARAYGVEESGNFAEEASGQKSGQNILHLSRPLAQRAKELNVPEQELRTRLEAARRLLFERRELRTHPLKDDKVLTDWNGLMIAALAKGARALVEPRYAEAAKRAAGFVLTHMTDGEGRLLHRYRDGESALRAYAADYAFLVWGLLELYEATFEPRYLERAVALNAAQIDAFWDESGGGFFSTSADGEELLVRQKDIYDGAVPSANSVAMMNLLRLARMTADAELESRAERLGRAFYPKVAASPMAHTQLMMALDFALGPSCEVVVAGAAGAPDVQNMLQALGAEYAPNSVVLFRPDGESPDILQLAAFTQDLQSVGGRASAYVCRNYSCEVPSTDLDAVLELLRQTARRAKT